MDNLYIRLFTDPILRTVCEPVTEINNELHTIISKMFICMFKNNGVGLSANQVGFKKRFCVVNLDNGKVPLALINPKIIQISKQKVTLQEGCLSCPRIFVPVKRSNEVVIEYQDILGARNGLKLTELDARIVLHELDHLDGKLIIDVFQNKLK